MSWETATTELQPRPARSGLEDGQMGPRHWARHDGDRLLWCLSDPWMCVLWWTEGAAWQGGCLPGNPCLGGLRRRKSSCRCGGDVCVSAVGVCVGARNSTAFCIDLCSQMCVMCVYLHRTGEFPWHYMMWLPSSSSLGCGSTNGVPAISLVVTEDLWSLLTLEVHHCQMFVVNMLHWQVSRFPPGHWENYILLKFHFIRSPILTSLICLNQWEICLEQSLSVKNHLNYWKI